MRWSWLSPLNLFVIACGPGAVSELGLSDVELKASKQIECTVTEVCTEHVGDDPAQTSRHESSYSCIEDSEAGRPGYGRIWEVDFPAVFLRRRKHELHSGETKVRIKVRPSAKGRLTITEASEVTILQTGAADAGAQDQTPDEEAGSVRDVLVVRVIANDSETTSSADEISRRVFGGYDDEVNLASQYDACSHGAQQFVPATGSHIVGGVVEVTIDANAVGEDMSSLQNLVKSAAADKVGSLYNFDNVMFCLPAGVTGGIAYGYVNSWLTVYNDNWCNNVSVQMHELGHNVNLAHSGVGTNQYGDQSCMMGYSYGQHEGPKMCFNGAKVGQLAWFGDREHTFDHTQGSMWSGKLVGIVDYPLAVSGEHYVVVSIDRPLTGGDTVFLAYNRKKGTNEGVVAFPNTITVVEALPNRYDISFAQQGLAAGESHTFTDFDGTGRDLTVSVTSMGSEGSLDYAMVTVDASGMCTSDWDCDNGVSCDGKETCNSSTGACEAGEPVLCDNGFFCDGQETCDEASGACVGGTPPACDDGLLCNGVETCDEASDGCLDGTPVACDDGLFCNGQETCDEASGACVGGTPPACDDGLFCNGQEACDEASGACVGGTPPACDDGLFCNGQETCDEAAMSCVSGSAPCGDSGTCEAPSTCDEQSDRCEDGGPIANCCGNGICEAGESCDGAQCPAGGSCMACPEDCDSGANPPPACGNGVCEDGENCRSCPSDCNGLSTKKPSNRFCCSGGSGAPTVKHGVRCDERTECNAGGFSCTNEPRDAGYCCGDGFCEPSSESADSCVADCGY